MFRRRIVLPQHGLGLQLPHVPSDPKWNGDDSSFGFFDENTDTTDAISIEGFSSCVTCFAEAGGTWEIEETTPEPGTLMLVLAGGALLLFRKRRLQPVRRRMR